MDLMIESLPRLLNATKLTIELTLLSLFFGIFVGVFFATLMTIAVAAAAIFIGFFLAAIFASFKLSKIRILNLIGSFYTTVFRGVPELLVIYLFFFWWQWRNYVCS